MICGSFQPYLKIVRRYVTDVGKEITMADKRMVRLYLLLIFTPPRGGFGGLLSNVFRTDLLPSANDVVLGRPLIIKYIKQTAVES